MLIVGGLGIHSYSKAKGSKRKMAAMSQVETTQVTRQDLVDSISVTGTIASADSEMCRPLHPMWRYRQLTTRWVIMSMQEIRW